MPVSAVRDHISAEICPYRAAVLGTAGRQDRAVRSRDPAGGRADLFRRDVCANGADDLHETDCTGNRCGAGLQSPRHPSQPYADTPAGGGTGISGGEPRRAVHYHRRTGSRRRRAGGTGHAGLADRARHCRGTHHCGGYVQRYAGKSGACGGNFAGAGAWGTGRHHHRRLSPVSGIAAGETCRTAIGKRVCQDEPSVCAYLLGAGVDGTVSASGAGAWLRQY